MTVILKTKATVIEIEHLKTVEDSTNNPQKNYTWKIQLTIANNFVSSNDND